MAGEFIMSSLFDTYGRSALKLLKFICTAVHDLFHRCRGVRNRRAAPIRAGVNSVVAASIMIPSMQFRPQIFDFLALSAIVRAAMPPQLRQLCASLWLANPARRDLVQSSRRILHPACSRSAFRRRQSSCRTSSRDAARSRGLVILTITAAAAASTLCTFLIPARAPNLVQPSLTRF